MAGPEPPLPDTTPAAAATSAAIAGVVDPEAPQDPPPSPLPSSALKQNAPPRRSANARPGPSATLHSAARPRPSAKRRSPRRSATQQTPARAVLDRAARERAAAEPQPEPEDNAGDEASDVGNLSVRDALLHHEVAAIINLHAQAVAEHSGPCSARPRRDIDLLRSLV
uniref:Uncharacterized protein n=1 Tax=Arundo donax TaxID=35708 RepID=A0A0A9AKR6_ARUDO